MITTLKEETFKGNPEISKCVVCLNTIPKCAQKCTKCGSFQDWKRHVLTWSGIVTAVLALLPVWAAAVSLFKIAFPKDANIRVIALECKQNIVKMAVFNSGGEVVLMRPPNITGLQNEAEHVIPFNTDFSLDKELTKILPEELEIIELALEGVRRFPTTEKNDDSCELRISFKFESLDGSTFKEGDNCRCPSI
ncbi:hypothetical protein [Vibrio natriegens]|uniref:hypothetical protein n=1 Tax=Vibrio natriegens TaxID=691 RepID=UPI00390A93EB